jgi:CRP-like cAMP-binding protein
VRNIGFDAIDSEPAERYPQGLLRVGIHPKMRQCTGDFVMRPNKELPVFAPEFFAGLKEDAVAAILSHARSQRFEPGSTIITGGDKATHLFLLKSGKARYYRLTEIGEEVLLHLLVPGNVFGLGAILERPLAYVGSAETILECDLIVWGHESIRKLAVKYPQLAENVLRIVIQYLRNYTDRHVGLVTKTAGQRLATALLALAHNNGRVRLSGVEVYVTNAQLAALADISHFTASRLLNDLQRKGIVRKHRGKVLIRAPEALLMG